MTPNYLIKLAKKQLEAYIPPRIVPPLAQVKAQQLNIPLSWLLNGSMTNVMNFVTNRLKNGEILTKHANQETTDPHEIAKNFMWQHRIWPQDNDEQKRLAILNSPCAYSNNPTGLCSAIAYDHSIPDPNVIKGMGENVLSINKVQNIFNIKNVGSPGRDGGTRLA